MTRNSNPAGAGRCGRAFSLIELLVVVAVLGVAMALIAPAFQGVSGAQEITRATDMMVAQLAQARQTAIARNRNVEVRFYTFNQGNEGSRYRAFQAFLAPSDTALPWESLGRFQPLPPSTCFDSGPSLSPLIASQTPVDGAAAGVAIPGVGTLYQQITLTFRPDGTALPTGTSASSFLAIKESRLEDPLTSLPANYALIQIFPRTGLCRAYRP